MYETIKFKPFEFPSWDEAKLDKQLFRIAYQTGEIGYYLLTEKERGSDIGFLWAYTKVQYGSITFMDEYYFSYSQQGYTDACNWLNDQKYELYRKAGV